MKRFVALLLLYVHAWHRCAGFSVGGGSGGGNRRPPSHRRMMNDDASGGDPASEYAILMPDAAPIPKIDDEDEKEREKNGESQHGFKNSSRRDVRGGSNSVVQGTKATLSSSASFWSGTFGKISSTLTAPFRASSRAISSMFRSKEKMLEEKLLEELSTMPVENLEILPNTTIVPPQVIRMAARRSGILGQPLKPASVQEFARSLKRWYAQHGYILHTMTGATLRPETATAEITLQEPVAAKKPVDVIFCKELIVDEETGELLTKRQYKEKHETRKYAGFRRKISSMDQVNTTLVETSGRTKPSRIASALQLEPGKPFRWDSNRWRSIASSGIFAKVLRASPQEAEDGSVQMLIVAQEAPARHLEYGLGRSLYTGAWEGELDFEHGNLLGGGEVVGLSVRRGAKEAQPSVRVRFSDDHFGLDGGYEVEAFSDFIGGEKSVAPSKEKSALVVSGEQTAISEGDPTATLSASEEKNPIDEVEVVGEPDFDAEVLKNRRGATFRLQNPIDINMVQHSAASWSVERTSTQSGLHEDIGAVSLLLGPFERQLPLEARSNIECRLTTGTRVQQKQVFNTDEYFDRFHLKPYAAASATTRQIFPLLKTSTKHKRPVVLALRHAVTTSTSNLPRHEARAQGIANTIRDSTDNGLVASALRGTTELRIPVDIPKIQTQQDGKLVFFGDWLLATPNLNTPIYRKSSVGVGLRKSVQGIPVRYDLCYTWEGKIKGSVGLGRDFEA